MEIVSLVEHANDSQSTAEQNSALHEYYGDVEKPTVKNKMSATPLLQDDIDFEAETFNTF